MDGVWLGHFRPGTVRDVSAQIGMWLVAQGYAEPEMRRDDDEMDFSGQIKPSRSTSNDQTPRRRSTDRS